LTDFPVYVDLSDLPAGFHTNCNQTDARDIRVTRSDGVTECAREVVSYDSTNDKGELHFKANSISSSADTDFISITEIQVLVIMLQRRLMEGMQYGVVTIEFTT
jgi:hypothetical protein